MIRGLAGLKILKNRFLQTKPNINKAKNGIRVKIN